MGSVDHDAVDGRYNSSSMHATSDYFDQELYRQTTLNHLDTLTKILESNTAVACGSLEVIATMRADTTNLLKPITQNTSSATSSNTLATKAFDVPEILEQMLSYLDVGSILRAQQVSHSFHDCVGTSPMLQRRIGFLPDTESFLRFPVNELTNDFFLCIEHDTGGITSMSDDHLIRFSLERPGRSKFGPTKELREVGARVRSMLVCQPPVTEILVHTDCCGPPFLSMSGPETSEAVQTITARKGVTYGDILDVCLSLKKQHKLCPHASVWQHDSEGFVDPKVTFTATVTVREADPWLEAQMSMGGEMDDRFDTESRLHQYMAAKIDAMRCGLAIPTLAEFKAAPDFIAART